MVGFRAAQSSPVPPAPASSPTFVQANYAVPQSPQSSVKVVYTHPQAAGDTNVLAIGWNDATSTITSVTDAAGNTYASAAPVARGAGISQAIYYASNIKSAAAGANSITVSFNTAVPFADVRILEYSGINNTNPLDVHASASGTSSPASSGSAVTTAAKDLLVGAGITTGAFSGAGNGYASRVLTSPDGDIVEDQVATAAATYAATAPGSGDWVMQMVGFRAAP